MASARTTSSWPPRSIRSAARGDRGPVPGLTIAFLDSWHPSPALGSGTAVAIHSLAQGLGRLGHRVHTLRPPDGRGGGLVRRLRYNAALPRRLLDLSPDLAVGVDLDGCLLGAELPCPLVVQLKGVAADESRFERGFPRLLLTLQARLEAGNARRAHRVVVPSAYSARVAASEYGIPARRMAVVPESIHLEAWEPREPAPPQGRPPTILTVGRQYPRKDTATLLRALPLVRRAVPDARVRVVGGGPELHRLRDLARTLALTDAVDFDGPKEDRALIRRRYRDATCFCLPSRQEGFGIVLLEAMAAGLPVVAARAGAIPEVVPDGRAGLLVPPGRPAALAAALIRLLRDPSLAARLGREGRRHVPRFETPTVAARFLESVEEILPPRTASGELHAHRTETGPSPVGTARVP